MHTYLLENLFAMHPTWKVVTMSILFTSGVFARADFDSNPAPQKLCVSDMINTQKEMNRPYGNATLQNSMPMYSISIENKCGAETSPINMHFMVVNEDKRMAYNNGSNLTASITDHVAVPMSANTIQEFGFRFARSATRLESGWRLWWDTENAEFSRNQTLVEVHCAIQELDRDKQDCNVDVSTVDGLTSSVKVEFQDNSFPDITLDPPAAWRCPQANRIGLAGTAEVPTNFLPEAQACLSNCSLLHTDSTCCPPPYTPENCTNANPALVEAGPEAYTYAYDDQSVRCNDKVCVMPLRAHSFWQNSRIMHVTTCFTAQ